jgi:hypothetical protein
MLTVCPPRSTAQVVTCATDVRQGMQRSGAKFYISEKEYFASRQEKLKVQFRGSGSGDAEVGTSDAGGGEVSGSGDAQSSANSTSGQRKHAGEPPESRGATLPVKQIFGESTYDSSALSTLANWIFLPIAGLKIYVNGYTGPKNSDRELKRLISVHGGDIRQASPPAPSINLRGLIQSSRSLIDTSACTHILVDKNLSASKAQKILGGGGKGKGGGRAKQVVRVDCKFQISYQEPRC